MLKFQVDPKAWDPNETVRFDAAVEEYRRLCQGMPDDLPQTDMDGSPFDPYWSLARSIAQQYHVAADQLQYEAMIRDQADQAWDQGRVMNNVCRDSHGLEGFIPDVPDSEF